MPSENRYARLYHRVWKNQRFRKLSNAAKVLFFHTFTNDACGLTGLYQVEPEVLFRGAGLSDEEGVAAWREIIPRFVRFDRDKGMVWVVGKFGKEQNPSPLFAKGVQNEVLKLPKCRLVRQFCIRYGIDTPSKQYRRGYETSNRSNSSTSTTPYSPPQGGRKSKRHSRRRTATQPREVGPDSGTDTPTLQASRAGRVAGFAGDPRKANPHTPESGEWNCWDNGWIIATTGKRP